LIGTTAFGNAALPNAGAGVRVTDGASGNTIGGTTSGGNQIAFNLDRGVVVESGIGSAILQNSTFSNTGLGIDLGPPGVTANDLFDRDPGANTLQNFPVLATAQTTGTKVFLVGTLGSSRLTTFRLEFFASPQHDPSGYGEGQTFLGSTQVTTNAGG